MKKTLRTIGALALCAVLVPALGSCGGDDDDEPGGGGVIELDGTRLTLYNNLTLNYDSEGRFKSVSSPFTSNAKLLEIDYSKGSIMLGDGEEEMEDMDVKFNGRGYSSGTPASSMIAISVSNASKKFDTSITVVSMRPEYAVSSAWSLENR